MKKKIWQVGGIRNHLLAVKAGVEARRPTELVDDNDGGLAAYGQGCDAALRYLAESFGLNWEGDQLLYRPQTGELRLRTWNLQDIRRILAVARMVMVVDPEDRYLDNPKLNAYYTGIEETLNYVAISFGLDNETTTNDQGNDFNFPVAA